MCEFVSWVIDKDDKALFVTSDQLLSTEGQKWCKQNGVSPDDNCGHGTIRKWFGLSLSDDGGNRECTDFSTPDNFPTELTDAIKAGKMRFDYPKGLLRKAVYDKWHLELDAVMAKRRLELDAVMAKRQPEIDAVYAKWQPEIDAVYAKWQPEIDAARAKFWVLFSDRKNRTRAWR